MPKKHVLSAVVLTCVGFLPLPAFADSVATPPPQIYHIVTSAMCSRLREGVRPSVAMILENDAKIGKSPPLFKKYQRGTMTALGTAYPNGNGAPAMNDSIYNHTPETEMALQQMSYLVIPIARNLISAQTLLDDVKLVAPTGNAADDATLKKIKSQLLETIAFQSASLDIINGFVQTQQMGELQHVGEEYLGAIQGGDLLSKPVKEEPNQWQDPNTPGLPPNPYAFDPSTIPGLAVGYNPLSHIMDGLTWLQTETQKRENAAGTTITAALHSCGQ